MAYYEPRGTRTRAQVRMNGHSLTRSFPYRWEAVRWAEAQEAAIAATGAPLRDDLPAADAATTADLADRGPTVAAYAAGWLRRRRGELAAATLGNYRRGLPELKKGPLHQLPIRDLTRSHVQDWRSDLLDTGMKRGAVNFRLKVLRMVCRDAVIEQAATFDATAGLKLLHTDMTPIRPLTDAEVSKLLINAPSTTTAAMIALATDAGLRFGEAAGLGADSLDLDNRWIHVTHVIERETGKRRGYPKAGSGSSGGRRYRLVPITTTRLAEALAEALAAMSRLGNPDRMLFTDPRKPDRPLSYDRWTDGEWYPLRTAVLDFSPRYHDLRHTYGTNLARAGMPRANIARLMGHADEKTTARYIHASDDDALARAVRLALAGTEAAA